MTDSHRTPDRSRPDDVPLWLLLRDNADNPPLVVDETPHPAPTAVTLAQTNAATSARLIDTATHHNAHSPHLGHTRTHPAAAASRLAAQVDRKLLRTIVTAASEELTTLVNERATAALDADSPDIVAPYTPDETREIGRNLIKDLVQREINAAINLGRGATTLSVDEQHALQKAAFDWMFGLGPIQHLVDEPDITDIYVNGTHVWVEYPDGHKEPRDPITDGDDELVEWLVNLAQRAPGGGRPFSPVEPHLRLALPGHIRLTAMAWTTPHPQLAIRLHRLTNIDLDGLVDRDMMPPLLARILAAVTNGGGSTVISGEMGAGKTTAVRALANSLPTDTRIGTAETERELYLEELPDRAGHVVPGETITGGGERNDLTGDLRGRIDLHALLYVYVRMRLDVVIVGEVAGSEIIAMFKAMQFTPASMTTVHARQARSAIDRIATIAQEQPGITAEFATRQVAHHINLIVQLERRRTQDADGTTRLHRRVQEVIFIEPGEIVSGTYQPAVTTIYLANPDGTHDYGPFPPELRRFLHNGDFPDTDIPTSTLDYVEAH